MAKAKQKKSTVEKKAIQLKIYFLPNLLTAGNLFCGFVALTRIVEANIDAQNFNTAIRHALLFILLACIFDLFDGRIARMGGRESPFGREFDSLADLISFGVAPAFLVHRIVLRDVFGNYPEIGWFIASVYLICGALRLARYNCIAEQPADKTKSGDFLGFPIPAAAALVASLTMFLMWWDEKGFATGNWRFILPVIMLFLSVMMVSEVKYPSFKSIDWRTQRTFTKMVITVIFIGFLFILRNKILPIILPLAFTAYLVYGLIRTRLSQKLRYEIEEEAWQGDNSEDENTES
ncbi:MAG: CDP-diacylglycerol--serine O-phosphatidyltransferase [Verrucomicrobia bacterium]|nr:CDP-diacylglycerol--serine O-phosphatidyltransferase [Verrucomicrobiota bacterium]MCF7708640.1 CDP-diacylglycerol--serine O-phosphatidyltransferase [Verrucomicrobiota bacterium]